MIYSIQLGLKTRTVGVQDQDENNSKKSSEIKMQFAIKIGKIASD
jgi:hypothetical protein